MSTFKLPDLGEGLPEAEIVQWHVKEGDTIKTDEPLVSVETAKAVVEVPSPQSGVVRKLYAKDGEVVKTGAPLVDFDGDEASADASTDESAATTVMPSGTPQAAAKSDPEVAANKDQGTVVGSMPTSDQVVTDDAIVRKTKGKKGVDRIKATPAVRSLARELGVDLSRIKATGKKGQVTPNDVRSFAEGLTTGVMSKTSVLPMDNITKLKAPPKPQTSSSPKPLEGAQHLKGTRRYMAQTMSAARDQIANCTLFDDADIHDWASGQDITARIIRALCAGVAAEPSLNAWYDGEAISKAHKSQVDLALAIDTDDGLIVPVLRAVEQQTQAQLRALLENTKQATRERTVSPQDMQHPTITLSNFGMMAGRYATPVIVPPMVAILGTGGVRHDVVAVMGGVEVHRRIPLSLSFDHRCVTGGEACRFLAAVISDLKKSS